MPTATVGLLREAKNENATYCGATRSCCTRIWDCDELDPWPQAVTKQQRAVWWGEADLHNEAGRLRRLLRQLEKLGSQCVESCQAQRHNQCFQKLTEVAEKKLLGQDITVHQKQEEKKFKALVEYNNQNRGWYFDSSSKWLAEYQKNLDKSKQPEQRQWNQNALAHQLVVMAPLALHSSEQARVVEQKTMDCCACKKEIGSFDTVLDSKPFVISFCTAESCDTGQLGDMPQPRPPGSCERTGHWQQALGMAQLDQNVSAESYKALIAACQASAATTAGAALMRQMHGEITDPGFPWLWTLAKLQLPEAELRACAAVAAIRALEGTVSPAEFAMVSWSLATLGVASPQFRAACSRQASSLHRFTTQELGHLAFGLAASPDAEVFLQLQREVRARLKMVRWSQVAAPLRRKALEDDLLNVLWSCSFAGAVDPPLRRALGRCFRALGASLDKRFRNSPAPLHSSQAFTGPSVRLELCDRLVLFKPVGWEVCDGNVGRQLRHFVNWKGSWPILQSAQHDHGFLHRVDVPCSGLILFAKSFRAYYDLQVQLRAGEIRRDYCVLCHGWFAQTQRRVNALVTWQGDGPTRSGSVGKPARTEFKALAHILLQLGTATLTVVRIATGRRHQIRSHCSFMGHAVVRDEKYTALQTQELDFHVCDSIFLHRHSLFFHDLVNGEHEVLDHLPADLISALAGAAGKDPSSTAALNRVIHGDLQNWELSEPITCSRMQSQEQKVGGCEPLHNSEPTAYGRQRHEETPETATRLADTLPLKEPLTPREAAQVARSLAQHRKLQEALDLLGSLQSLHVPAADVITFNIAINSCSKVNHWVLAEEFYSVMRASSVRPTAVTLNSVVNAHERSGNWQAALGRLMSFQNLGVSGDAISFNTAITACARAKQWSFALSILRINEDFMEDSIGYNAAASAFEKVKLWCNVLDLVQSMHVARAEADHFTFSTTLSSLSGAELWQSVFACLKDMQVSTDNFVLSAIIKACEASTQWHLAMHYLSDLEDRQLQPDVALLNSAISAAAKAGEWEQAFSLISSLQHIRLEPDVITWGAAATACERAAQWRTAIALLKSMRHSLTQPNACVCNAVVSSCEKSGQWEQALLMLDVMNASEILPDLIAYNATISACSRTHWQMSLHLLHVMDSRSVRCDTISYNACITACERGGRWQEALACLHAMSARSILINTVSYNAAIAASGRQFHWKEALHLLWSMELLRLSPDVVTYNAALAALGDSRSWKTLCALFHDMRQHVIQPDLVTFNTSLSVCFHWQTTVLLWHLMVQDQVWPDLLTYNSLLTSLRHHQSWQTALSLLGEMKLAVALVRSAFLWCASRRCCLRCKTKCLSCFAVSEVCKPTTITFEALISCGIHRQHLPIYMEAAQGQIICELHVMAKL
ncbi:unnamed protein product [Symbiodinium necroappetens]|uniref:Pseudouridine synthase RsuA/RluA-like domain-containing protein n=1 Tax=Symbiodinium necroappetens TaxID=1628268 RepID=A0A813CIV1_9DINO|nr:unnamed protein product [Symbiodinium necroappetens]